MGSCVDNGSHSPPPAQAAAPYIGEGGASVGSATSRRRREKAPYVQLEIRTDTLFSLLYSRSLVIEDLRGLDGQAQRCIRQLLLDTLRL